jgi:hypothetical protein
LGGAGVYTCHRSTSIFSREVSMGIAICTLLAVAAAAGTFFAWRFRSTAQVLQAKYSHIVDVEAEIKARRAHFKSEADAAALTLARTQANQAELESSNQKRKSDLGREYEAAMSHYKELKTQVSLLEENVEDLSFGLYKPHFNFNSPDDYKAALTELRDREREIIQRQNATSCPKKWTVGNSEKEGARMVKQQTKLMLRAFNGECDAAVANVSWNNASKMEERIRTAYKGLNELGGVLEISITSEYLNLKLNEIRLTHELEEKKHEQKEQERKTRERIRDEEKALKEFEKAKEEAEREELRYQKALEKAREEAALATGAQLEKLNQQLSALESKLQEAKANKDRAISRAQMTKSGFVYVISNIGSFGEKVYKIGMTRRLDPFERVAELSDASVPFAFDVHAMLYSDNAPQLEGAFHEFLEARRVNLVNARKESL